MTRRPGSGALVVAIGLFAASGCGGRSGNAIDAEALADELAQVVFFAKQAEGFDYDVRAACASASGDGLHYTCHVRATSPGRSANEWDELVACRPPQPADVARCTSASGYALQ